MQDFRHWITCGLQPINPSAFMSAQKMSRFGLFCGPLLSSDTVSGFLHCLRQILRFFFSWQAFNHWPLLGLLPGCVNSLLAISFHQKLVSSMSSSVRYFPHNCWRGFSVGLIFPVYISGSLKKSLELRARKRSLARWAWKQVGVWDPRWTSSTQRPVSSISKWSVVHLVNVWIVCRFSPFSYLVFFSLHHKKIK